MIAFTADNHIGVTTQWSIKERGADFMRAFSNMVDKIIEKKDKRNTLIIGGDLFDTAYPPSFAVEFVQSEIQRLKGNADCDVFGIDGNHDIADGKWLRVCGIHPLDTTPTFTRDRDSVGVCGIHYHRSSEVISEIKAMADAGTKCDILVLHLALGELNRMGAASDIAAHEIIPYLKEIGVKMVLIGHIHIRQSVVVDGITFAYCGSTEMCSMNEPTQKSFTIVDPKSWTLSAVDIETRKIEHIVISTEEEFARYASGIVKGSPILQSVFITPNVQDGVKRVRGLAHENGLLMRVQVMRPESSGDENRNTIDRTTGIICLEQAIELSFDPSSKPAELVRALLRSPETCKMTIDGFMSEESDTTKERSQS